MKENSFKFKQYDDLQNNPVDVFVNTVYLGTLQVTEDGSNYEIKMIKHPNTGINMNIKSNSGNNTFKTKLDTSKNTS